MNRHEIVLKLLQFWSARSARERTTLIVGLSVVVVVSLYSLLIDPALSGRTKLGTDLPALRLQAAQIQELARQAAAYSGKSSVDQPVLTEAGIRSSLQENGLTPRDLTLNGNYVQVKLSNSSFAGALHWLDDMQRTSLLTVVDASISATSEPGKVDATLSLRQSGTE